MGKGDLMAKLKFSYLCPYCFERSKINNVKFRCTNEYCTPEEDSVVSKRTMSRKIMKKAFRLYKKPFLRMPKKWRCPSCQAISTNRICPRCHSQLPNDIDKVDSMIIAVIGAKNAGKSHYITVLIQELKNQLSADFNFAIRALTDKTSDRYDKYFRRPVYEENRVIDATQTALVDRSVMEPLIYELKFHRSVTNLKTKKIVDLIFFDTAGEDLNDEDIMSTVNKYIYTASGIIFLLDPLQLPEVRRSLPPGTPLPDINTESETIISRTINLIRRANKIPPGAQIDIPVAVSFTKIDALEPILAPASALRFPSRHRENGRIIPSDFDSVSMEMESVLRDWQGNDFAQQLAVHFKHYSYFGLSALGCNPHGTKVIKEVRPFRVEDPFLWLLWKAGVIR
jgi:GTPase SAR1 family protein